MKKTRVISVLNQKGGASKTTTAREIAYLLAGSKNSDGLPSPSVLMIDMDASCNLTTSFDVLYPETLYSKKIPAIYNFLTGDCEIDDCIFPAVEDKRLYIVPGHRKMLSQYFTGASDIPLLRDAIDSYIKPMEEYDFIIIDVGPTAGQIMMMVLYASDYVVAPAEPGPDSFAGLQQLCKDIELGKKNMNGFHPTVIGMLMTRCDPRTNVAVRSMAQMKELAPIIGGEPFNTVIHSSVTAVEAKDLHMAINAYKPNSVVAEDYRNVTREMLLRIQKYEKGKEE